MTVIVYSSHFSNTNAPPVSFTIPYGVNFRVNVCLGDIVRFRSSACILQCLLEIFPDLFLTGQANFQETDKCQHIRLTGFWEGGNFAK